MFEKVQPKLFLTGKASRQILREAVGAKQAEAGGIWTREESDGITPMRYILYPAAAIDTQGYTGECFIDFSHGLPQHDTEIIRSTGTRLLQEAQYYNFSVFDELGNIDVIIPQFMEELNRYLFSGPPCIGSLKRLEDAEILRLRLGLSMRYTTALAKLMEQLKEMDGVLLLNTDKLSEKKIHRLVDKWRGLYL